MPDAFKKLLASLPVPTPQELLLCRFAPQGDLERNLPPDYLFTSGNPGRYNPGKVNAFYASQDAMIAGSELDRRLAQIPKGRSPPRQVLYSIKATLSVLDLNDDATLRHLDLTPADLRANWEFTMAPTLTQRLGHAVSMQTRFAAICAPSAAAAARKLTGFNYIIFPSAIVAPMSVVIQDDAGREIQSWPVP
ncbi:MAG: RES domain-containing protein [Opitutaceae bacterium]|nr:RES domain-containing protein [Opitutaceae bacterium]